MLKKMARKSGVDEKAVVDNFDKWFAIVVGECLLYR